MLEDNKNVIEIVTRFSPSREAPFSPSDRRDSSRALFAVTLKSFVDIFARNNCPWNNKIQKTAGLILFF